MTSIKAKMNKDKADFDGLSADDAVAAMLENPERSLVIVARLDVVEIGHNVVTGVRTPKVAHRHVEIMQEGDMEQAAIALLDKRFSERTGRAAPPASLFDAPASESDDGDDGEESEVDAAGPAAAKGRRK